MSEKKNYWQIIRGICILAVVMIHCPSGAGYSVESAEFNTWLILRQVINFPVAIFVFLSGYFTNIVKWKENRRTYFLTRGGRLIIPFVLWSAFYSLISIVQSFYKGQEIVWWKIAANFITGKASAPLYYIIVLVQLTLLTPYLIRVIEEKRQEEKLLWFITPTYLVWRYVYHVVTDENPMFYESLFPAWFFFYYLGLQMKINGSLWENRSKKYGKIQYMFFGLLLCIVEAYVIMETIGSGEVACSQLKISNMCYNFVMIMFLFQHRKRVLRGIPFALLEEVGNCSYGIYYIHCFVMMFPQKLFKVLDFRESWYVFFVVIFFLTAVGSYGAVKMIQLFFQVIKKKEWLKYIGM